MVSEAEKQRATEVLAHSLEKDGLYRVLPNSMENDKYNGVLVEETHEDQPSVFYVALHTNKDDLERRKRLIERAKCARIHLADAFYKDGENFFRLFFKQRYKSIISDIVRHVYEKKEDKNKFFKLATLGKLESQISRNSPIAYYQPKTVKLKEGIRVYTMEEVPYNFKPTLEYGMTEKEAKREWNFNFSMPHEIKSDGGVLILEKRLDGANLMHNNGAVLFVPEPELVTV